MKHTCKCNYRPNSSNDLITVKTYRFPVAMGTTNWVFSAGWKPSRVLLPAFSAGNKLFHPYQVGTSVDYPI